MRIVRTAEELREALPPGSIGLVPTMGAFHDGHLSLFRAARAENDVVVVSLYVNPAQFGEGEDLDRYPRDEQHDRALAEEAGVDVLFAPANLYGREHSTWVDVEGLDDRLEGRFRPGHFRGVATVCLKLFNVVRPNRVYFGQKDAQQAEVIERMLMDLDLEIELRVLQTVRDTDNVALSSRNAYLSQDEREAARALPRALFAGELAYRRGEDPVATTRTILAEERRLDPDYVELAEWNGRLVLAAAVRAGKTRLIDNVVLEGAAR